MNYISKLSINCISYLVVAVTMVTDDTTKVFCALFHDCEDGAIFGRLVCSEILHAFTEEYAANLTNPHRTMKDFAGFNNRIADVIRNSVKPVLVRCKFDTFNFFLSLYNLYICKSHESFNLTLFSFKQYNQIEVYPKYCL